MTTIDPNIFEDNSPITIANNWLNQEKTVGGSITLRWCRDEFYKFEGGHYQHKTKDQIKGGLYEYLSNKSYITARREIKTYNSTKAKVCRILNACKGLCRVDSNAPVWLGKNENNLNTRMLLAFRNGILDIDKYVKGEIVLYPPTPDFFTMNSLPYDFDQNAESELWNGYIKDVFNGDQKKIQLLSEWIGYNCVPDISHNNLMLFIGMTASSKSTVVGTMEAILGEYPNTAPFSFDNTRAFNFLASDVLSATGTVYFPITLKRAKSNLQKMLHIVKGDVIDIHPKYRPALLSVKFPCRFTIMTRSMSVFGEYEQEMMDMANILAFSNSYVGRENRMLKKQLKDEAKSGRLINFALRGLKSLYQNQGFITPGY
ncbi:MAG: hypothetical protein WBL85_07550 [Sedimentisphaerales bacterium]